MIVTPEGNKPNAMYNLCKAHVSTLDQGRWKLHKLRGGGGILRGTTMVGDTIVE